MVECLLMIDLGRPLVAIVLEIYECEITPFHSCYSIPFLFVDRHKSDLLRRTIRSLNRACKATCEAVDQYYWPNAGVSSCSVSLNKTLNSL